ncbi:MAG: periplasmic heavy metal sensor [Novosphingobium aromaticivorans]|jgi:hypothetical protein|nr:periplasmic heavy metal sensor [Novosphingobium aromaticivorans]
MGALFARRGVFLLLVVVLGFCAAFAGAWAGRRVLAPEPPMESRFHTLIHHDLALDAGQQARIAALETRYEAQRAQTDAAMRADNRQLAEAIRTEHGYGPRVAGAVDRSHQAMGLLQKQTLQHLFAMRAVLRPDQAARFDAAMVEALTAPTR